MCPPRLEDYDAVLASTPAVMLGSTIGYKVAGAAEFTSLAAHVYYTDKIRSIEGADVMDQDIKVELPILLMPTKPGQLVRIRLDKHPTRLFRPANVTTDDGKDHWIFDLKDVPTDG